VVHDLLRLLGQQGQAVALQGTSQLLGGSLGRTNQLNQDGQDQRQRHLARQGRSSSFRWPGLLSLPPLLFLPLRVGSQVDNPVSEASAAEVVLSGQGGQQVADGGAQQVGELRGGGTAGRVIDQSNEGPGQGAVAREADGAIEPQAIGCEAGPVGQGIVAGVVVEAAEVAVTLQGAADGDGGEAESRADLRQGDHRPTGAEVNDTGFLGGERHE
jgi:hypothetical protein